MTTDTAPSTEPAARPTTLHWVLLAIAIVAEVAATTLLKSTEGFTRLWPSVIVICCYEVAFLLLVVCVKHIAVGVVYALWSGIGIALVTIVSWAWLGQPLDGPGLFGIALIGTGVVVMQAFSRSTHA